MVSLRIGAVAGAACCVFLALALLGCEDKPYPIGRDTLKSFGDGRFQILWDSDGTKVLYDCTNTGLDFLRVYEWRQDGDWVYAVNDTGEYAVLNYCTAEYAVYKGLDAIPQPHKESCEKLKP